VRRGSLGMLAVGETICILAGVFDLSVGSMVSVTAVVATKVALANHNGPERCERSSYEPDS